MLIRKPYLSGFTFIKNGLSLGFPIKESIQSIETFCDEVIINVGYDDPSCQKDDGTYDFLRAEFPGIKFKFIKSYWDKNLTSKGLILSEQTNRALEHCQGKYAQYIQGDEVIHESDIPLIIESLKQMDNRKEVEGIVFKYLHFYGNVNIIKHTRNVYRREVRLIRNHLGVKSWLDAQGFKNHDDTKLKCILSSARIFHYGWARQQDIMLRKINVMDRLYHGDKLKNQNFKYQKIWGLKQFAETHPQYMKRWIDGHKNDIDILKLKSTFRIQDLGLFISDTIEKFTNYRMGEYKNYKLI